MLVQKGGVVKTFASDEATSATTDFIDVSGRVNALSSEAGLLGMAFHPNFAANHQAFLSYTASAATPSGLRSIVSRFTSTDGGLTLDPATEEVLLTVDQPFTNHNGGNIAFGPDGRLYIGLGDGGSGGDPFGNGQNTGTLLGKILRIDVDTQSPYAIPADNPFASGGGRPEIYAYGLRNPWRFTFDRATGDLWAGDVGQNQIEEVDLVKLGGNYGWNTKEGSACYQAAGCSGAGLVAPVAEYTHAEGVSITGGYVYRGKAFPWLVGRYVYADFGSGKVWALAYDAVTGSATPELLVSTGHQLSSFGEALDGELYLLSYSFGSLMKFVPSGPQPADAFPKKLSQTGCFDPVDPSQPAPGLIPYQVNAPFWSDGAQKQRWLALPDGAQMTAGPDGDLDLPIGSVLAKSFSLAGERIETRLFVRHDDGGWAGYSYEWDADGKDATWVPGGKARQIAGQTWTYPSSAQCLRCHTQAAGSSLGLELAQLNGPLTYPGGNTANQLATLEHIGMFAAP
jgi:glucose/arabinose dehydrogenase